MTVVVMLIPATAALGQAGFLDPGFGGTGMIQIGFGGAEEIGQATAVQSDGLLLVAGIRQDTSQVFLVRLGTNNLPDPSFGSGGVVAYTPPQHVSQVGGLAVQSNGKIVVAGTASASGAFNNDFMLARFNSDGSLDPSFGNGGFATADLSSASDDTCNTMVIQSDGKIVVGGETVTSPGAFNSQYYLSLARFDTNGNLDASFGSSGVVLYSGGGVALTLALEGDGNILTCSGGAILRYTTNGVLDGSFGSGGKVTIPTANEITALTILGGGIQVGQPAMIVAAGTSSAGALVSRISLGGTLDTTINGVGYVAKSIGSGPHVTSVRCFISGVVSRIVKMLISGDTDGGSHFMAARFNNDGSTDTTFGSSGVALTSIPGDSAQDSAFAVMPGPLLVQVGTRAFGATCENDIVVARYVYSTGILDTNFYGTGVLITNFGDRSAEANAVSIQKDGKILIAGYCVNNCGNDVLALCRLNSDSTLDPTFGSGGKVVSSISSSQSSKETPMILQPDGRILVAAPSYDGTNNSIAVTRFLTNGVPDGSFGTGGTVLTVIGTSGSYPNSIALQSDGKIVVSGLTSVSGNDIAILRFNTNGSPDTTWNGTGKLLTAIGSGGDSMAALAIQPDGKIIDSGASAFSSVSKFSMLRCATNGTLDNSFGSFGKVATTIPNETVSASYAMTLQPDHKIILAGVAANAPDYQLQLALARYNTNGVLDTTFGNGGAAIASIGLGSSEVYGVALQSDGKIVAACRAQNGLYYKFAAARFMPNGVLDPNYGFGGVNYFDYASGADENVNAMALDSLGRVLMVGHAGNLFAVVRVTADTALRFTSITRLANQHIFLTGNGVPNASHTLLKGTSVEGPFTSFAPLTTDSNGNWQYEDATVSGSAIGFYRLSYP